MPTDPSQVIVTEQVTANDSVHVTQVHHRAFSQINAEAEDAGRAAGLLLNRLTHVLDTASDPHDRESVESAIADVRTFLDHCS